MKYNYKSKVIRYHDLWQHSDFTISTDPQNVCTPIYTTLYLPYL